MEEDYRSASKRFWQTVRRLRRGKQYSANTVYSAVRKQRLGTLRWTQSITQAEVTEVVRKLLGGKAPGVDEIRPEYLKSLRRVLEGLWEFAQPVHMCFVDLEKAFDRVPRGILWGVLREYGVRGPLLRAVRSLYDRSRSLIRIAGRFLGVARGRRESWFGNHRISSLLFADDVVLLASSGQDLQHVLERFAAECEAAGMRISTSKSEAMVLDRKRVACPLSAQVTREELGDRAAAPSRIERSQLRWLGHLFRVPPGRLPREVFQACPTGRRPGEDPGHAGETMSLSWPGNAYGIPPEELEEVSGVREVWASLLRLLPPRPGPGPSG
ncbi:hypothetical protein L3Q82_017918 [Scortum barcoo]|uniref:Uncharacterized protein n=1 Tax=Scortum barcoo TaxID=214431 RepID=A0ACB8VHT2_9TELE|nr:hypothetical protein L3Q82_017918 [Scortum barcoo]